MNLETLFKRDVNGKLMFWKITIYGQGYSVSRGFVNGKMIEYPITICANPEQAESRAYKKWKDKQEVDNYQLDADIDPTLVCQLTDDNEFQDCELNKCSYLDSDPQDIIKIDRIMWSLEEAKKIRPMLAETFDSSIDITGFTFSPKLDGIRALSCLTEDGVILSSRNGKLFEGFSLIRKQLSILFEKYPEVMLDGELYTDQLSFNKISGIVRSKKRHQICDQRQSEEHLIEYHIFDMVDTDLTFRERYQRLQLYIDELQKEFPVNALKIKLVPVEFALTDRDLPYYLEKYTSQGYEGVIMRDPNSIYKFRRTFSLLKHKLMKDSEFEITDVISGTGTDANTAIFICKTKRDKLFNVRPRGSITERKEMLRNRQELIGKMLTVRYQELSEFGVPRFPVGITVRDYE